LIDKHFKQRIGKYYGSCNSRRLFKICNDKPVVVALREIADNVSAEEVLGAGVLEAPDEMTLDQDQTQEPVEISIG